MNTGNGRLSRDWNNESNPETIPLQNRFDRNDQTTGTTESNSDIYQPGHGASPENDASQRHKPSFYTEEETVSPKAVSERRSGHVRRHKLGLCIYLAYAVIAILSWTFTCLLSYHPVGVPTWLDTAGNYTASHYEASDRLRRAANIGFTIVSTVGVPLTSAIAARAATVYCQRNSGTRVPQLTMRQMLALADKGWSGLEYIRDTFLPRKSKLVRTPLLLISMLLVLIGKTIPATLHSHAF